MNYLKSLIKSGVDRRGFMSKDAMEVVKATSPVFCADAIIIPESKYREAVLFWRSDKEAAIPGCYWVVGGRQRLGEPMEKTVMRKIRSEAGLNLKITPEDQLFTSDAFFKKVRGVFRSIPASKIPKDVKGMYHTPQVCYLARAPAYDKLKKMIKPGDGNTNFKLFTKTSRTLDPYINRAMKEAWERLGRI